VELYDKNGFLLDKAPLSMLKSNINDIGENKMPNIISFIKTNGFYFFFKI
jgi:hypothetical protein